MKNYFTLNLNKERIYGLDILRAAAILFVLIEHGKPYLSKRIQDISDSFILDGVSIFFVLSGFLIGGILIKLFETKEASIRTLFDFWIRRWFRTLPNYYFVLFLLLIFLPRIFNGGMQNPFANSNYLFFIQNFNKPHLGLFGEAWSLSVEEQFYLIVPIILFLLISIIKLSVKNAVLTVAVSLIIISMVFRYFKYSSIALNSLSDWDLNIRKEVLTRLDSNMYGVVGAFMFYYYNKLWKKYKNILLGSGIAIIICHRYFLDILFEGYGIYKCVFSFSLVSLGVLFTLPFLNDLKKGTGIIYKVFTFISIISYSLYLVNYSIFNGYAVRLLNICSFTGNTLLAAQYIWYWLFSFIAAYLLYRLFEKPMMELREKFNH